jgi:sulfoxide reductase heme-binding subunit YedZ
VAGVIDALWYFARGSGLVSLVLLTIVVALGIGARSGRPAFGLPRFAVSLPHRNAALLAVTLLAGHVLSLLLDPYAQLRVVDLVVPFVGGYRPFWLGLGTLAFDLVLALVATSLLWDRLGARAWRAVHWLAYLCWPIALLHGLQTGAASRQHPRRHDRPAPRSGRPGPHRPAPGQRAHRTGRRRLSGVAQARGRGGLRTARRGDRQRRGGRAGERQGPRCWRAGRTWSWTDSSLSRGRPAPSGRSVICLRPRPPRSPPR